MRSATNGQFKVYMIYALRHPTEAYIYVGKTSSPRLSAAYSDHICQRVDATSGFFDKAEERPELYLLSTVTGTRSLAYKYVLAWIWIFKDGGFGIINPDGTLRHAAALKPDTQAIVDQLREEPLEKILQRTHLEKPTDGDRPPEQKIEPQGPLIQMNLRIAASDKALFSAFCKEHQLNQREGFSLLLDRTLAGGELHQLQLLEEIRKKNRKLTEENKKLRQKLAVASGAELPASVQRALALLPLQKEGIARYLEQILPEEGDGPPLKRSSYRKFMRRLSPEEAYVYPPEEGILILRLEAILWGNALHRACFLVGSDGQARYKLRYYPRTSYAGIGLDDTRYVRQDSRFILGCQRSKDGAMELVFAFPLPEAPKAAVLAVPVVEKRKSSLDERIREIQNR